jgi:hypothetical protein
MSEEPEEVEVWEDDSDRYLPVFSMYREALVSALHATEDRRAGSEFEPFREYANDPVGFAREVLGWTPWAKQEEIGRALVETKRVSVVSCNGAGKTVWAARLLMWFLYTRKNSLVINTAPTFNQVSLLWRQVKQALAEARYELPGRVISGSRLELAPTWYGTGISTDKEERFQGYHPEGADDESTDDGGMLVIVDEASGVPDFVFDAMRGYLTQAKCYVLLIGNGNKASGAFFDSHQKGPWSRFNISAHDVPGHILDPAWIEEQRLHWGELAAVHGPRSRAVPVERLGLPALPSVDLGRREGLGARRRLAAYGRGHRPWQRRPERGRGHARRRRDRRSLMARDRPYADGAAHRAAPVAAPDPGRLTTS